MASVQLPINGDFEVADLVDPTMPMGWTKTVTGAGTVARQEVTNQAVSGKFLLSVGGFAGDTAQAFSPVFTLDPGSRAVTMHASARGNQTTVADEGFDVYFLNLTRAMYLDIDGIWKAGALPWFHNRANVSSLLNSPSVNTFVRISANLPQEFAASDAYKVGVGCMLTFTSSLSIVVDAVRAQAYGTSLTRRTAAGIPVAIVGTVMQ